MTEEKARWEQREHDVFPFEQILDAANTLKNNTYTATNLPSHKPFMLDKRDISTGGEIRTNS